jgi:hypothetical protein
MKIIKPIIFVIALLSTVMLLSTILNFDNSSAFDTVATFLSITIGFTITALSIIATSAFSKELYKTEYEKDNSKTLLHVLINLFKTSTFIFILTIGLILIYKFIPIPKTVNPTFYIKTYPVSFYILLKSTIWCLTILSFFYFIRLFETFAKFVIKTATRQ